MAFKGDLTNISLFDVFQTLSQNKQTGVLVLTKDGATKKVHISPDGVRIFFTRSFRALRLGEIFVRRGRITPQDVEIILLEQKKQYRPTGELLIESGKVTEEEVADVLRYHAEDEIFEVFGWDSGNFSFYDGQEVGDPTTPLSDILMDPAGLCLEAARRLDEMERLRESIPNDTEYYLAEGEPPDPEEAGGAASAVFHVLAEPNSIDELRDLAGLSLHDTLTGVKLLLDRQLIRTLTLDELLGVAAQAEEAGDLDRAARLLEKAHAHEPHDRAILEKCVEVLGRLNQPRPLANYLATLGKICLIAGEVENAIEYLEEALRNDASHGSALTALRDAYVQQGDAERVAEVSLKLARAQADRGELNEAIATCREGIEHAPQAIALRFYHAQTLARSSRVEEAQEEMYAVIRATEGAKAATSDKAYELLTNCYRLLLKIDPNDAEAERGLHEIDRRRMLVMRRKKLVTRGGAAAALLLVLVGIGLATGGQSAESLASDIRKAQQKKNMQRVAELVDLLIAKHPDSPEAKWALEVKGSLTTELSASETTRRKNEQTLRDDTKKRLDDLSEIISNRPFGEAMGAVRGFVKELDRPELAFLRKTMGPLVEDKLCPFFDRVTKQFDNDRKQVASGEVQLRTLEGKATELSDLEAKLDAVLQREWTKLVPRLTGDLMPISESQAIGKASGAATELAKTLATGQASFSSLETLYHTVRRERFRAEILDLHRTASTDGQEALTVCDFEGARQIFEAVRAKIQDVIDQEPREVFAELITWIDLRNIRVQTNLQLDRIDRVTKTLQDVEALRSKKNYSAAYRVMRDLVSENRLIEFEKKYKLPYEVVSVPAGAEVEVDGKTVGTAPCEIQLEIGQRAMIVRLGKPGFKNAEARLVPTDPALDGTLEVDLRKDLSWDREVGGNIEAYPTIADGKALFATTDASLLALDLKTGDRAWETPSGLLDRIKARPLVAGKSVYMITLDGHVHQIRMSDGKLLGSLELGAKVEQDPVARGDTIYVATRRPSLVAIRGANVVWEQPLEESPITSVVFLDGTLYVGTARGAVLVHDAKTGAKKPEYRVASGTSFWGGLSVHGKLLLAGAEDGKLYAFDTRTGKQAWAHATGGPLACPAVSDGTRIYLPARDGYIHVLSGDGEEEEQRKLDMGYAVKARPSLEGGFLYLVGSNRVKAFDTKGDPWWDRAFEGEFPVHVIAGGDHVIVVTDKPWIYAFPKDIK